MRFREIKVAKEKFYASKKPVNIWDVNTDNIAISQLIQTKTNSKYLIGYLDKVIRSLVLVLSSWVDILRHLKLKIKTIWCLSV